MTYNNKYKNSKLYRVYNMLINELELQKEVPIEELPHSKDEVGYINVAVNTASGALPVQDAIVTLYHIHENNEEHILYHLITDKSGIVPKMEVPVNENGFGQLSKYYYSTYNLRVEAPGYYTVNVLDVQAHPDITTNFRINLIPVSPGKPSNVYDKTIVIPPKTDTPSLQ